ncbi:MAG: hypothetical protein K1X53_06170 [Candidatus Sumerlaeaceae bacterium]|nr:hypothetical protein [Candidatus Sumerlaeaceae bacterium]
MSLRHSVSAIILALPLISICQPATAIQEVTRWTENPTLFDFGRAPQIPCFGPPEFGARLFERTGTTPTLEQRQDATLLFDGLTLPVSGPTHKLRATSPDAESQSPMGYWAALQAQLATTARTGNMHELRFTDDFAHEMDAAGVQGAERYMERLVRMTPHAPSPIYTFDMHKFADQQVMLRDKLRRGLPRAMIGCTMATAPATPLGTAGWDYAIVDPETAPPPYRDQAAVSFFRSRIGAKPVLFHVHRPDFHQLCFWYSTGAAGFYFDKMPATGSEDTTRPWREMRSFASIRFRFKDGVTQLLPEVAGPGAFGAFGEPGDTIAAFIPPDTKGVLFPPRSPMKPWYTSIWFNPQTDESILLPPAPEKAREIFSVFAPSSDEWLHIYSPRTTAEAGRTTVTLGAQIKRGDDGY